MKKLLSSLLVVLTATSLVGCAGTTEKDNSQNSNLVTTITEPVTVEFWHALTGANGDALQIIVDEFNKTVGAEKNITVKAVAQGSYADLKPKVVAAIKANEAPLISQAYPDWVAEYLQAEVVVPLNDYINHKEVGISDFNDIAEAYRLENSQYDDAGTFYSLPFNKSTEVLYYNKTFFEANGLMAPSTWTELEEVSKQITGITGNPAFGFDSAQNAFITLVQQFGGEYTNSKGEVLFGNGDAALKTLELIKRNSDAGYWRLAGEDKYMSGPFVNEMVQMYIGSTAGSQYVNNDKFEWSSVPVPQVDGGKKAVIQQGTNVVVMNQDRSDEEVYAAYEFAKYLSSTEGNLLFATNTGYLPIRQSVIDSEGYKQFTIESNDSTKESGPAQSSYMFYDPAFFTDSYSSYGVRTEAGKMVENVVLTGMEPQDAIDQALSALK